MEDKPKYDNYNICPVCGGTNTVKVIDVMKDPLFKEEVSPLYYVSTINQVDTTCNKCGHEDYWSYGSYDRRIGKGE